MGGTVGRLGWGVSDQALSSLTNFLVGAFVARTAGIAGFGAFSIAFATYLVALNVSRGLCSDPLLVRYSGADPERWRHAAGRSAGTSLLTGAGLGLVCVVAGAIVQGPVGASLVPLGLFLPGLLLQDCWRFAFFTSGRAGLAFANDLCWAIALLAMIGGIIRSGRTTPEMFMVVWGMSATLAAFLGRFQAAVVPCVHQTRGWLRQHKDLSSRYLAENLSTTAGNQLRSYGLGAITGLAAVGSLKAADLVLGPVFVLVTGMGVIAVPEAARKLQSSPQRVRRLCLLVAATGAAGTIGWGGGLMLLAPEGPGRMVLGASWEPAFQLLLPTTIAVTGLAIQIGAWAGVRALGVARRSLRSQMASSVMYLVAALTGGALGDAPGAAWGGAVAATGSAFIWWWQLHRGLRVVVHQSEAGDAPIERTSR
jgi:O-antigen/teichoic acid export membrane protein